jgi:hypothetical protein
MTVDARGRNHAVRRGFIAAALVAAVMAGCATTPGGIAVPQARPGGPALGAHG